MPPYCSFEVTQESFFMFGWTIPLTCSRPRVKCLKLLEWSPWHLYLHMMNLLLTRVSTWTQWVDKNLVVSDITKHDFDQDWKIQTLIMKKNNKSHDCFKGFNCILYTKGQKSATLWHDNVLQISGHHSATEMEIVTISHIWSDARFVILILGAHLKTLQIVQIFCAAGWKWVKHKCEEFVAFLQ